MPGCVVCRVIGRVSVPSVEMTENDFISDVTVLPMFFADPLLADRNAFKTADVANPLIPSYKLCRWVVRNTRSNT